MKFWSEATLGHPGADFKVSGHPPAPILGEKVMRKLFTNALHDAAQNLCARTRNVLPPTSAGTRSHPARKKKDVKLLWSQLSGNAFRKKKLLKNDTTI